MIYIELDTPKSVESLKVKKEIQLHIKNGLKTNEIGFKLLFFTLETKEIANKFQVIKNKIAFHEKTKNV